MKFQCDRCKKPYLIADERVRGKILKIRCKNCSAIITVREGAVEQEAAAAASVSVPMAQVASAPMRQAMRPEARPQTLPPPVTPLPQIGPRSVATPTGLHGDALPTMVQPDLLAQDDTPTLPPSSDWYLSIGGEQDGPFSQAQAREWIARQDADAEVYCWRDGFGDWRSVEDVPAFQRLRRRQGKLALVPPAEGRTGPRPVAAMPMSAAPAQAQAPAPGHASMQAPGQVPGQVPGQMPGQVPGQIQRPPAAGLGMGAAPIAGATRLGLGAPGLSIASAAGPEPRAEQRALELNFDEPSRVFRLDMLGPIPGSPAPARDSQRMAMPASSPLRPSQTRLSAGAMPASVLLDDAGSQPGPFVPPRRRAFVPLLLGVVGIMALAAVALVLMVMKNEPKSGLATGPGGTGQGNFDNLGYRLDPALRKALVAAGAGEQTTPAQAGEPGEPSDAEPVRGSRRSAGTQRREGLPPALEDQVPPPLSGGPGAGRAEIEPVTPLTPDDVIQQSNRSQISFQRCYERARKKDPFLQVKSIKVELAVARDGTVTEVKLLSNADTFLGQCIAARIQSWKFRASTEGIKSLVPLVFEQE